MTMEMFICEGDTVNVEVRKKASQKKPEKTVYVSFIDEDDKDSRLGTQSN